MVDSFTKGKSLGSFVLISCTFLEIYAMKQVDHIGIAVSDLSSAIDHFSSLLNTPCYKTEEVESQKEKSVFEMNSKEQRAYYKQRSEDARINRYVNNLSARDIYVKNLEDKLINLQSYVQFNKLEEDVEKYRLRAKAINEKNKKT